MPAPLRARRRPLTVLLSAGAAVAALVAAPVQPVSADVPAETHVVTWPSATTVVTGTAAAVTVAVTDYAVTGDPATDERVATLLDAGHGLTAIDQLVLTPAAPSGSLNLPTTAVGSTDYVLEVSGAATATTTHSFRLTVDRAPTTLAVHWPGFRRVRSDGVYTVAGTVSPAGAARPVQVQTRTATGWLDLATTSSSATGAFSVRVPTTWTRRHRLRVVTPQSATALAGETTAVKLEVTRRFRPRSGTEWARLADEPARWNPCAPAIRYAVNPRGLPRRALPVVHEAVRRLAAESGLRLRYVGRTRAVPFTAHGLDPRADLVLAWTTPRAVPALAGTVVGLGGFRFSRTTGGPVIVDASVAIDRTFTQVRYGYSGGRHGNLGELLLHELGHAVGLGHVGDPRQILYPRMRRADAHYGRGDIRGLTALGAAAGCVAAPARVAARTASPWQVLP